MKRNLHKILFTIYRKIKIPFSILKTNLLILRFKSFSDREFKSASDNGVYPELALKAAMDPSLFSVFRRHHKYNNILEHVSRRKGEEYLKIIREKYKLKDDEIFQLLKPLMKTGNPKLLAINGFSILNAFCTS